VWKRQYEADEKPTALKLKKQFNAIRREQFPWTEGGSRKMLTGGVSHSGWKCLMSSPILTTVL
jgi:hypothetical protein